MKALRNPYLDPSQPAADWRTWTPPPAARRPQGLLELIASYLPL